MEILLAFLYENRATILVLSLLILLFALLILGLIRDRRRGKGGCGGGCGGCAFSDKCPSHRRQDGK